MTRKALVWLVIAAAVVAAYVAWSRLKPQGLPPGLASGNGRIEATDVDVATKSGGRLKEVLVKEGDDVQPGQILARAWTRPRWTPI